MFKKRLIICENVPAELPKDVIRSETKLDDGLDQLNLNLSNIRQRFERGLAGGSEDSADVACNGESQNSNSAGVVIERPSFDIKQFRKAFESPTAVLTGPISSVEKPVPKKLGNINGFFNRSCQDGSEDLASPPASATKPLPIKRSESLIARLKKYESRIAGEQVVDEDESGSEDDNEQNKSQQVTEVRRPIGKLNINGFLNKNSNGTSNGNSDNTNKLAQATYVPKTLNLSTLKIQWENGDIKNRRLDEDDDDEGVDVNGTGEGVANGAGTGAGANNGDSGRQEELLRIRQQLARGRKGSVKNIYEQAIKEAQEQAAQAQRRPSNEHLSVLNGLSTSDIQQQLLQQTNGQNQQVAGSQNDGNISHNNTNSSTIKSTPSDIEQIRLNASRKAKKLRERFELGLVNNSRDDSDLDGDSDGDGPGLTKLEQIRQEKLEDLSIFTEGEIVAREARNIFQQIDRRISASSSSNGKSNGSNRHVNSNSNGTNGYVASNGTNGHLVSSGTNGHLASIVTTEHVDMNGNNERVDDINETNGHVATSNGTPNNGPSVAASNGASNGKINRAILYQVLS